LHALAGGYTPPSKQVPIDRISNFALPDHEMRGESVNRRGVSPQILPHRSPIQNTGYRHAHPDSRREEWHVITH
jgi:hypothetical protein